MSHYFITEVSTIKAAKQMLRNIPEEHKRRHLKDKVLRSIDNRSIYLFWDEELNILDWCNFKSNTDVEVSNQAFKKIITLLIAINTGAVKTE